MPRSNTRKGATDRAIAAERRVQALELRKAGLTYDQIAERIGISRSQAHGYVTKALNALDAKAAETAEQLRRLEVERIDKMLSGLWLRAVGTRDVPSDPLVVDRVVKLMERRARLLGLDAPAKAQVELALESEVNDIARRLAQVLTPEQLEAVFPVLEGD